MMATCVLVMYATVVCAKASIDIVYKLNKEIYSKRYYVNMC